MSNPHPLRGVRFSIGPSKVTILGGQDDMIDMVFGYYDDLRTAELAPSDRKFTKPLEWVKERYPRA